MGEQALTSTVTQAARLTAGNDKPVDEKARTVVYWMNASYRVHDNAALAYAVEQANALTKELLVVIALEGKASTDKAQYDFIIEALPGIAQDLGKRGIALAVHHGDPVKAVLKEHPALVVCDEMHTKYRAQTRKRLAEASPVRVVLVDANVIVPVRLLGKEEWAAYTIRPKLWKLAPQYLVETKLPKLHAASPVENAVPKLRFDVPDRARKVQTGGEREARTVLAQFLGNLGSYKDRNDPSKRATSSLSGYLHFGMISPVTVVQAVTAAGTADKKLDAEAQAFVEQAFVRREVAHNFTFYNQRYDYLDGCPQWARDTLDKHRRDTREYTYTFKELEDGKTHDDLWNAAQHEMRRSGYMHNYLRMLWCKKILEWSETPEQAFQTAVELNDRYELDGRDPNGYTGVAWSIGGKHDRPWFDRAIYGAIRYMSSDSARKKFDADAYEQYVASLAHPEQH